MNNLRQSQSASVVDHFKQKQSTKLSTGSVDRKRSRKFIKMNDEKRLLASTIVYCYKKTLSIFRESFYYRLMINYH